MEPGAELLRYKRRIVRRVQSGKTIDNIVPIEITMLRKQVALIEVHNYEYIVKLLVAMFPLISQ